MNSFFWDSGHLGWGIFTLIVFSGLWLLLVDLCWRLLTMKSSRLLVLMGSGWAIVIIIIFLEFYFIRR